MTRLGAVISLLGLPAFMEAHTLPISDLTLVPGEQHLHLELSFNPFELSFFAELDADRNRRLDPDELSARQRDVVVRILDCLEIRIDGKTIAAEVSGLSADTESHHVTLRAHYRVDARLKRLMVTSRLAQITSGSHVTRVHYRNGEIRQAARFDQQTTVALFPSDPGTPPSGPTANSVIPASP